jgi:hypothetical protein
MRAGLETLQDRWRMMRIGRQARRAGFAEPSLDARSRERVSEVIRKFSTTEADSAWQLVYGINRLSHPLQRASLFHQVLEEMEHAERFESLYREITGRRMPAIIQERLPIYRAREELWKLFPYCQLGEASAARQFGDLARTLPGGSPLRTTLEEIVEEESGHVEKAEELTALTGRSVAEVRAELRRIKLRRARESWLRLGRRMVDAAATAILSLAYHALGPWARRVVLKSRARRGWELPSP